jgi:hypothetical protein
MRLKPNRNVNMKKIIFCSIALFIITIVTININAGTKQQGQPCIGETECIGSGKCESNNFGQKFCTGN